MTNEQLDLIETRHLVDALGRRFKHVLVVTCVDRGGEGMTTYFRGGFIAALGLCRYAENDMLQNTTNRPVRTDDAPDSKPPPK